MQELLEVLAFVGIVVVVIVVARRLDARSAAGKRGGHRGNTPTTNESASGHGLDRYHGGRAQSDYAAGGSTDFMGDGSGGHGIGGGSNQ